MSNEEVGSATGVGGTSTGTNKDVVVAADVATTSIVTYECVVLGCDAIGASGVGKASTQTSKEVVTAKGVATTSIATNESIEVAGGVGLSCTGSSKEVVSAGVGAGCGQATYVVTGATNIECRGCGYQATVDVKT